MEPLLSHPSGLSLHHFDGRRFDLRFQEQSLFGPFTLSWDLGADRDRPLVLETTALTLAGCRLEPVAPGIEPTAADHDPTAHLEYHLHDGLRLELTFRLSAAGLELVQRLTVTPGAGHPARVQAFRLLATQLEGSFLAGVGEAPGWRFFSTAYNSFSPSFARDSRAVQPVPLFPTAATFNQYDQSIYWGRWSDLTTPWMATIHQAGLEPTLLVGFLSAKVGLGEVALRRRRPSWLEVRLGFGGKQVAVGETLAGEGLRLAFGSDGDGLIRDWTLEVAKRMGARVPPGEVPAGWCSWYYYYTGVTEKDLHGNLETLVRDRSRLPVRYVQLDDGYQAKIGDWLTVNEKFPSGLQDLARRIRDAGFAPGIWTAPFLVQRTSRIFREHPDWLLRNRDGELERLAYHPFWGVLDGQVYSLDPTHPEVLAWLRHVFTTLAGYGYELFKIDFLIGGLREGRHYDPGKSPLEAFRQGITTIREAIGDRFLLGCGAPLLPSIGVVDGMRISSDVKEQWRDPLVGLIARGTGHPAAALALQNCITRAHLHRAWWFNDPDCLLVRDRRSSLKLVEVQTLLTVLSLTGGMLLLSDDLQALSPDRRALAELALPPGGAPARAIGLRDEDWPRRFLRYRELPGGGREALAALINWSEELLERAVHPVDFGLPAGRYHAFEFWSRTWRRLEPGDQFPLTQDPHETALILFRPAAAHPQLITATHHIGQTTVIVPEERWDPAGTLTIHLRTGAAREGMLWVAIPEGFELEAIEPGGGARLTGQTELSGAVRLNVPVDGEGVVRLFFRRS